MNSTRSPKQDVHPYAISVDWLQVYCFVDSPDIEKNVSLFDVDFDIVKMTYSTRQFRNVYKIYKNEPQYLNQTTYPENPIKHNRD